MEGNPKVSIIIPAYNSGATIKKCLLSIMKQDYDNLEIIVVDDGSTDNSLKIVNKAAAEDSRIRVIADTHQGVSASRNMGLAAASGEYILFCDSDNFLESEAVSYLVSGINDCDMSVGLIREITVRDTFIRNDYGRTNTTVIKAKEGGIEISEPLYEKQVRSWNELINTIDVDMGGKLYKNSIIKNNNMLFDWDISYGEDVIFMFEYLKHADRVFVGNHVVYNYVKLGANSLTTIYHSKMADYMYACQKAYEKALLEDENDEELKENAHQKAMVRLRYAANHYLQHEKTVEEYLNKRKYTFKLFDEIPEVDEQQAEENWKQSHSFPVRIKKRIRGFLVGIAKRLLRKKYVKEDRRKAGLFTVMKALMLPAYSLAGRLRIQIHSLGKARDKKGILYEGTGVNKKYLIAIDPGHQGHGMKDTEPIRPGASKKKMMLTTGTEGVYTKIAEHELNLEVALRLRDILINKGYTVFMIRESKDVDISNLQRAVMANRAKADVFIRIHANSMTDTNLRGALMMNQVPKACSARFYNECNRLAGFVLDDYCQSTGFDNGGIIETNELTGTNWSYVVTTLIEMGYMSNKEDDLIMATDEFKDKAAYGIASGIEKYLDSRRSYGLFYLTNIKEKIKRL